MNENIEKVLAILDGFRMCDEMTYSAYSALHDEISRLDDLLKAQEPLKPFRGNSGWACSACGNLFHYPQEYCDVCGRQVNWDG